MGDSAFENQIGDFFTLLATEKRFIQLEKGYWDLRENHTSEVDISALEDEEDDVYEESTNYYDDIDEMDDDKSDDDLKDLVIVDENYDDESEM